MWQSVEAKADAKRASGKNQAKKYTVSSGIAGRLLALVLVAAMVVTSGGWSVLAEENTAISAEDSVTANVEDCATSTDVSGYTYSLDGTVSNNVSDNNYSVYYASTVKSYLMENEDGSIRGWSTSAAPA